MSRHSTVETHREINPLAQNHLKTIEMVDKLRLASSGTGITGRMYGLIVRLLPLGIKLYGKYNRTEIISIPGVFEFGEPSLYGLCWRMGADELKPRPPKSGTEIGAG